MTYTFLIILVLLIFATMETGAALLHATGLPKTVARFQAYSIMSRTGYSTRESDRIMEHPIRRRIAFGLILLGMTAYAAIISAFSSLLSRQIHSFPISGLFLVTLVLLIITNVPKVQRRLSRHWQEQTKEQYGLEEMTLRKALMLKETEECRIISVKEHPFLEHKRLKEVTEGLEIVVLFIRHGDSIQRRFLYSTTLRAGDILYVYGERQALETAFSQ